MLAGFGERGEALAAVLKRPRLSWNVAIYHRARLGIEPPAVADGGSGTGPEAG